MKRIRLGNTVFEGLNNAYLLDGEGPTALVDTGVATPAVEREFREGLAAHGYGMAEVDEVFLTHWHADHSGLAGVVQAESGATVRAHAADAPVIERGPAWDAMRERQRELFERWGMPDGARAELSAYLEGDDLMGEPPAVTPFEGDERFDLGHTTLEAMHLPGHTAGLAGFAFAGERGPELFSGDALLPHYTPNVGGADVRVERPLANYLDTLARIVDREFARAWPGHRGVIIDPSGRAADIIEHHRDRTRRVVDVLCEHGPADAWTVSAHLFGGLEAIHILHGPGEASAHLEHLADAGVAARAGREYALVDPDPDIDPLFPDYG